MIYIIWPKLLLLNVFGMNWKTMKSWYVFFSVHAEFKGWTILGFRKEYFERLSTSIPIHLGRVAQLVNTALEVHDDGGCCHLVFFVFVFFGATL